MDKCETKKKKSIPHKILQYLKASRVDGWYIAIIFFILGEWYAISDFPFIITGIGLFGLLGIMSTGFWINYVFDRDVDTLAGKDLSFFDYISPREMLVASGIVLCICSAVLLVYVNVLSFLIGLSIFFVGVVYSVPPIRLKVRPPFDVIANGVGESLAFLLGWSISGLSLNFLSAIGAVIIGLAVASHYFFYTSFDIETDKKCKVNTSCTKLGFSNSMSMGIFIFILALCTSLVFLDLTVITLAFIICVPLVLALKTTKNENHILFLVGGIFLIWSGNIGVILTIYSHSAIPLFITIITLLFLVFLLWSIWTYSKKPSKHE